MPRYYVKHYGYLLPEDDPGHATITAARKELQQAAKESLADARSRGWKRAAIIAKGPDHRAIHAMRHEDSPLWQRISIVSA